MVFLSKRTTTVSWRERDIDFKCKAVYTYLSSANLTTVRKLEILEDADICSYAEKVKI